MVRLALNDGGLAGGLCDVARCLAVADGKVGKPFLSASSVWVTRIGQASDVSRGGPTRRGDDTLNLVFLYILGGGFTTSLEGAPNPLLRWRLLPCLPALDQVGEGSTRDPRVPSECVETNLSLSGCCAALCLFFWICMCKCQ